MSITTAESAPFDSARIEAPSRADGFVRGLSETIGGPLGRHAVRPRNTFWIVFRVVVALACLTLMLHWAQKSDCSNGEWIKLSQYRHACYTDVVALYNSEGLADGKIPYVQSPVEYPVLTGVFMGLIGLPVHAFTTAHPGTNPYEWYYNLTALALGLIAVGTVVLLLLLRRRRPWDAAMFAASPALLLTATINWDLLAAGFAVFGIYAWSRRRLTLAGVMLALGAAAKLWPAFLLFPLLVLGWRARRLGDAAYTTAVAVLTWVVVNLPFMLVYSSSWRQFFRLNYTRPIDWGTLWYIGQNVPHVLWPGSGLPGFGWLGSHVGALNVLTYGLFGLACLGIVWLTYAAPRRPRLAQLAFLVVAAFLFFSKVWSQQYVLWLLPLALLARPRWGAFFAWQLAEVCYFFAFNGELMRASGNPIFPEGVFVLAAILRLVTLAVLCGFVIRDIMRPELDVVRHSYADDPDGGVLDEAPDRWSGAPSLVSTAAVNSA